MSYTFDTNVFVSLHHKYRDKYFKEIWAYLEKLMKAKEILISREVIVELEKGDDQLAKWIKKIPECIVESNHEIQTIQKDIINRYPDWVDPNAINAPNTADPFVIAVAKQYNLTVVTQEGINYHHKEKPESLMQQQRSAKIPNICELEGVQWIDLLMFLFSKGNLK
jgi:predicted nucleic acid-binding protein